MKREDVQTHCLTYSNSMGTDTGRCTISRRRYRWSISQTSCTVLVLGNVTGHWDKQGGKKESNIIWHLLSWRHESLNEKKKSICWHELIWVHSVDSAEDMFSDERIHMSPPLLPFCLLLLSYHYTLFHLTNILANPPTTFRSFALRVEIIRAPARDSRGIWKMRRSKWWNKKRRAKAYCAGLDPCLLHICTGNRLRGRKRGKRVCAFSTLKATTWCKGLNGWSWI